MSAYKVDEIEAVAGADIFAVQEIAPPPFVPDAHQVIITSVESGHSADKGTPYVQINWRSKDVPTLESNTRLYFAKEFEDSGFSATFDPKTLSPGHQIWFRGTVASKDKTATLQRLVFNEDSVARKAGRDPVELGLKIATTLEGYTSNLNEMLQGVDAFIIRKARGGDDPAFANQAEVKRFLPYDAYENNPKLFKNLVLQWENS